MGIRVFQPPLISRFACALAICTLLFGAASSHAAGGDGDCLAGYAQSGAIPGTGMSCALKAAAGSPGGMGGYTCLNNIDLIWSFCNSPAPVQPESTCPVADPVYPGTGSVTLTETDFIGGGDAPLTFTRTYRSAPLAPPSTGLGADWTHNWQQQLDTYYARSSPPRITAYRDDGDRVAFSKVSGVWVAAGRPSLTLTDNGSSWIIADRTTEVIETYSAQGVLASVATRQGWVTALTYSDANTPTSVAPTKGLLTTVTLHSPDGIAYLDRSLSIVWDSKSRISQVTDSTGAVTRYGYDANNNLTSVTWPDGNVRRYVYENRNFPGVLTGLIDETGSRIATWSYDGNGRATAVTHPDSTQNAQFAYGSGSTTVTDSRGNTALNFSLLAGGHRPTGSVGSTGATTGMSWYISGNLLSNTAADGTNTGYSYDSANRPIRQVRRGSFGTATTSVRYADANSLRLSMVAAPGMITSFVYDSRGNLAGVGEQTTDDPTGASEFDAKSGGQLRATGMEYDSHNRLIYVLATVNGVKQGEWEQTYDPSGNKRFLVDRMTMQVWGVGVRDQTNRPIQLSGPGFIVNPVYDVRGRISQFIYVEQATALNGFVSRRLTVDYGYSPDGHIVSRTGTVQSNGGTTSDLGSAEIDSWLWNYEDSVVPAGPAQGRLGAGISLRGPREPGIEPVCVECFIPPVRWAAGAVSWGTTIFGKGGESCQSAIADTSTVNWGANANQISHTFRYLDRQGISRDAVMSAVKQDLADSGGSLSVGQGKSFYVNVGGRTIEYSAYRLSSTEIRVGSIRPQ
ncbi:hypothetical protein R54767_03791 [Paraburkholderia gardini]|uniref:DUF6531 domain-containing protein n=2 Tax=Paraburkholderia gardini TaxID=2823469 RepID=A0ABN7QTJ4_9BURK|nr:hypothetical protein R54767_03791 [Paraburkholderia gardini]